MKKETINKKGLWVLIFIFLLIIAVYQLNILGLF